LTQIKYVFVYPDEHDVLIAGVSEPIDLVNKNQPVGKTTGRPVLHLDDLVTALRIESRPASHAFGCTLDPHPDSLNRSNAVMKEHANSTRGERMKALKEAMGPQQVGMFGAPRDSRLAFVTIAADYKLKRLILSLEPMPVAGIGSPVDNSRPAGNRFWFSVNYAPLLVSAEGDAYELRGPRLTVQAGAFSFDPKGATETAKTFAKNFAAKIPQLATVVPIFADLQNVADLSVVAALIRKDRLEYKAGADFSWILSEQNYKTAVVPTPTTAETLVNYTNGSLVAGGVTINPMAVVEGERERDGKGELKGLRTRPGETWYLTRGEAASTADR
jgi:hypothetical protein